MKEKEGTLGAMKKEVEELEEHESDLAKDGVDFQHELEKYETLLKENKSKIKHWRKEVSESFDSQYAVTQLGQLFSLY